VRARPVPGERLIDHFGPDRFDVAYSRNALDHAVDPVLIVENMLGVVRSGGHVVLRHMRNEGVRQSYVQLHQWNFDERGGHLIVWRPGWETDLNERLSARAEVKCHLEPTGEADDEWVVCVLRKFEG
jgi:hypothetical protein